MSSETIVAVLTAGTVFLTAVAVVVRLCIRLAEQVALIGSSVVPPLKDIQQVLITSSIETERGTKSPPKE